MSAKRVEYHEGAIADVKSAVAWYQRRSPKAALHFIEELHRATDTIRAAPERWPLGKNNTRRFLLWRFPFSIIYSEQESVITIWAAGRLLPWRPTLTITGIRNNRQERFSGSLQLKGVPSALEE